MRPTRPFAASARSRWAVRVSCVPDDGGGARCSTASARPPRRYSVAATSRSPTSGTAPASRSAATWLASRVSTSTRQRPRNSRSTRRPTSPQPTIKRRGRLKGAARKVMRRGQNRGSVYESASTMTFTVTVRPSGRSFTVERDEPTLTAAIRQGVGLPYGCKDGACGSCKSRLLEGRGIHGTHQHKARSGEEEEAGFTLTCRAAAQTDVVIEARTLAGAGECAVRKMPERAH